VVELVDVSASGNFLYESEELLDQYMAFHYGDEEVFCQWEGVPSSALEFPVRVAQLALRHSQVQAGSGARALDLGCAVGRTSFELSQECDEVLGVDLSESFIRHAQAVAHGKIVTHAICEEGQRRKSFRILYRSHWRVDRVRFVVGDCCCLKPWPGEFDVVVMANLLCRTADPQAVLLQAKRLVRAGGILLITTPCSWSEEFTPRQKWLCWETGRTLDGIRRCLEPEFLLQELLNLPFLIREHARKFQWCIAEATVWRRNPMGSS